MQPVITADDWAAKEMLQLLAGRMQILTPVMREIGGTVRTSIERNFAAGGRPEKWPESQRVKRKGGQTLTDKGRLRRSFTV
jgi:phage gpG-like protein